MFLAWTIIKKSFSGLDSYQEVLFLKSVVNIFENFLSVFFIYGLTYCFAKCGILPLETPDRNFLKKGRIRVRHLARKAIIKERPQKKKI
jgi:hypothetical protein